MEKLALVVYSLGLGGGERVVSTLSQTFAKKYDVSIIVMDSSESHYPYCGKLINLNCPSNDNLVDKASTLFKRTFKLKQLFTREKFDHIFSFMETANFPVALSSPKSLVSIHCNPHELSKLEWWLVKLLYKRAKHAVAVSNEVACILDVEAGLDNVERIYNPIDMSELDRLASLPLQSLPTQRPFIIAIGRLNEVKQFDKLINAFSQSKTIQDYDLLILGDGELKPALQQQIEVMELQDKVHLLGRIDNPFPYIAQAQFLALSSRTEAFPMVIIEALALSCPVVATNCPSGPKEIIDHRVNGLLVDPNSTEALTHAIDNLYLDANLLQDIKAQTKNSVRHLDVDAICKQWIELSA